MNKLFMILLTGAYIPWCIMLLVYMLRYDFFHFLSTSMYLIFATMKWSHIPHSHRNVIFWNRTFSVMEICLFIRLIIVNFTGSGLLSCVIMLLSWVGYFKLNLDVQKHVIEAPIYCVCLLFLMSSTSSLIQQLASVILISISIYHWQNKIKYESDKQMMRDLSIHYIVKITEAYMVFLLEWQSSGMNPFSLLIFVICPIIYYGWAYYSIEVEEDNMNQYLYNIENLPEGYPMPLNFKHAIARCKIAKKVFKDHKL